MKNRSLKNVKFSSKCLKYNKLGPGKSIALTLRISFLCYSDVINLAKSNTGLKVMNNIFITFFFHENGPCVANI